MELVTSRRVPSHVLPGTRYSATPPESIRRVLSNKRVLLVSFHLHLHIAYIARPPAMTVDANLDVFFSEQDKRMNMPDDDFDDYLGRMATHRKKFVTLSLQCQDAEHLLSVPVGNSL